MDGEGCSFSDDSALLSLGGNKSRRAPPPPTSSDTLPLRPRATLEVDNWRFQYALRGLIAAAAVFAVVELTVGRMGKVDNLEGFVTPAFEKVEKVFKRNFLDGWEREGAAVAVYHKGQLVVDLQGGYADRAAGRLWNNQTRTVVFSTTKAVGALCVALLVDRGHLRYEDRMADYWPEFAQNGKENVTIGCIMAHKAGLAALDEDITRAIAADPERMAEALAKQKPHWEPGSASGYHALTYGWLVDQIVRRADPLHRSIGIFFQEEIAAKHGIDFHVGLAPEEEYTVSRLSMPSRMHLAREIIHDPRVLVVLAIFNAPLILSKKVRTNPTWFKLEADINSFNDPELHAMEQVAALGIGKARDIGRLFSLMARGEIVSKSLVDRFRQPEPGTSGMDEVLLVPFPKGHGFLYERHPLGGNRWLVGHPGYGGSTVMMDLDEDVVISYVSNGLKTGMGELTGTYRRLRNAVFDCIEKQKAKEAKIE